MTTPSKPFNIDKREVYEAYLRVRSNGGAAGVDGVALDEFETDLKGNLYRIWNRMSSGTVTAQDACGFVTGKGFPARVSRMASSAPIDRRRAVSMTERMWA